MYCSRCAAPNADEARFCRACGATVTSPLQTKPGGMATMTEAEVLAHDLAERRKRKAVERGWMFLFIGVSFILMAFVLRSMPGGRAWWFWLFPSAAAMLGMGIAQLGRGRSEESAGISSDKQAQLAPSRPVDVVGFRGTAEMLPPASVTEGTTKLLESESREKQLAKARASEKTDV